MVLRRTQFRMSRNVRWTFRASSGLFEVRRNSILAPIGKEVNVLQASSLLCQVGKFKNPVSRFSKIFAALPCQAASLLDKLVV